jgi:hypothetical protein
LAVFLLPSSYANQKMAGFDAEIVASASVNVKAEELPDVSVVFREVNSSVLYTLQMSDLLKDETILIEQPYVPIKVIVYEPFISNGKAFVSYAIQVERWSGRSTSELNFVSLNNESKDLINSKAIVILDLQLSLQIFEDVETTINDFPNRLEISSQLLLNKD